MTPAGIVQKLWNYCNGPGLGQSLARSPAREYAGTREKPQLALRDDSMSYGDYVEAAPVLPCARVIRTFLFTAQLTFALTPTLSQRERGNSYDGDELFDHYQDQAG